MVVEAAGIGDAFRPDAEEDGLTEGFYMDAAAVTADGMLYFGSSSGITAVNPAIHSSASRAPQLAITDIAVFNRSLGLAGAGGAPRRHEPRPP